MTTLQEAHQHLLTLERRVHQATYKHDPAGWVEDCLTFPEDEHPIGYQLDALDEMIKYGRLALRGPNGVGKTAPASWAILWACDVWEGMDFKVATTATAFTQLHRFLWPEVHKWARLIRWEVLHRAPWVADRELLDMAIQLETGEAFAVASNNAARIEGAHGDRVLYVYDEAKSIPDETWDATEGAFAGAGADTGREAYALAFSTPGPPAGRFYAIQARKAGLRHWRTRHVTRDEAIAAGRMSEVWADKMLNQWGRDHPMYRRRVLGEFATDEDSVIPLDWIEAAVERGRVKAEAEPQWWQTAELTAAGLDIADGGRDANVLALRTEWDFAPLESWTEGDTMQTVSRVAGHIAGRGGLLVGDAIGVGAGAVARLRELEHNVLGFVASASAQGFTDKTGELHFANLRSAAWWNLRELLDPQSGVSLSLPDDEDLVADLATPRWKEASGGRVLIEPKESKDPEWGIRNRIGRSTDKGDAVVQAAFAELLMKMRGGGPMVVHLPPRDRVITSGSPGTIRR